jgi:hypothetical protein
MIAIILVAYLAFAQTTPIQLQSQLSHDGSYSQTHISFIEESNNNLHRNPRRLYSEYDTNDGRIQRQLLDNSYKLHTSETAENWKQASTNPQDNHRNENFAYTNSNWGVSSTMSTNGHIEPQNSEALNRQNNQNGGNNNRRTDIITSKTNENTETSEVMSISNQHDRNNHFNGTRRKTRPNYHFKPEEDTHGNTTTGDGRSRVNQRLGAINTDHTPETNDTRNKPKVHTNIAQSNNHKKPVDLSHKVPDEVKGKRTDDGTLVANNETTTIIPIIENRVSFDGGSCPTGKKKLAGKCVDVDT